LNAGPEACVSEKDHAIDYAQNRAYFRSGEIRILDSTGYAERTIPFNEADDDQLTSGFAVSVFADSDFVPSHVPTVAILLPQNQGKTRFFAFLCVRIRRRRKCSFS
jgi:hypothetical protein